MGDFPPFRRARTLAAAFLLLCLLAVLPKPAAAQSLQFTFGGTFDPGYSYNDAEAYDGTNYTPLDAPPLLNLAALEGGTFVATYTIPANSVPVSQTGTDASYEFTPASTIQFTLFDAAGNAVYQSSGPASDTLADVYRFPFGSGTANQIVVDSFDGAVSGVLPPATPPMYTTDYVFGSIVQFNFDNYTTPLNTPLSDLSLPTNAATYLAFPTRQFNVDVAFFDANFDNNSDGPFQFYETNATYNVTSARVTAVVPEPSQTATFGLGLLGLAGLVMTAKKRKAVSVV